ncbi:MAG: OmpA family protein [Proteobacteria bacterium]|nr:OmpA family protein [Pseudomonadota bacterium]
MKKNLTRCLMAALLSVCAASQAYADGGFDIRQFYSIAGTQGVFSVESSKTLGHLKYDINLMNDYANTPLRFYAGNDEAKLEHLVTMNLSVALGILDVLEVGIAAPFIPYEKYNNVWTDQINNGDDIAAETGWMGDLQVRVKGTILKREKYHGFGMGIGAIISMPTGKSEALLGEYPIWGRPYLTFDYEIGPVEMMLNTGFTIRPTTNFIDYTNTHAFNYGFGLIYHVVPGWFDLKGEIYGETPLGGEALNDNQNQAEYLLGLKVLTPIGLNITAGAGAGIDNAVKNPKYRVLFGLEFSPVHTDTDGDGILDYKDKCPNTAGSEEFFGCTDPDSDHDSWCDPWIESEDLASLFSCKRTDECPDIEGLDDFNGCPVPDSDNDHWCDPWVIDPAIAEKYACRIADECPNHTGIDEFNGCPNPDTDGDHWCDAWIEDPALSNRFECRMSDKCPDLQGIDDFSGCPNADSDADGICSSFVEDLGLYDLYFCSGNDKCPDQPEDFDDFQDDDGCPDPDNDHDGICDSWVAEQGLLDKYSNLCRGLDQCPNEPEIINGVKDDDGCPDKGKQLVFVLEDKIEIKDKIYFDNNKATIKKKSNALLDQIALSILANPDIKHVSIEGHTDDTGKYEHNIVLSRQRAQAVVDYLISKGVASERLSAIGYGPDKPLDPAKTKKARALNRRVEFVITERK